MRKSWILSCTALLALGCGSDASGDADAGGSSEFDAGGSSEFDAGGSSEFDAGAPDAAVGLCTGDCATMSLVANFGETTRSFDRAFFGLTSPQNSDSGNWELYIENGAGDDDQCPTMKSPTPDYLLLLAGIPLQTEDPGPITTVANLVDFEGALLTETFREEASANTLTWVAYDPCLACSEGTEDDRADRMLAADVEATFAGGTITGHLFATHCDSLDSL